METELGELMVDPPSPPASAKAPAFAEATAGKPARQAGHGAANMRWKVGIGGSLSGIKWDYAGRKSAVSRLIPDIPVYSRVMRLENF
jgi:hypothetical protein